MFQNERLSMNKQLEYFGNTKAQIISLLGDATGMELISNAIYMSNIGSNDYLTNFYIPLSPMSNLTSAQMATLLVRDYYGQLTVKQWKEDSNASYHILFEHHMNKLSTFKVLDQ